MSHTLTVVPEKNLMVYIYEGEISFRELIQARQEMFGHPEFKNISYGVCDFRKAHKNLSKNEFNQLSDEIKHNQTRIKWCLLNSTPRDTGLSSLFKHKLDNTPRIGIFSTVDAASDFLGMDLTEFLP